MGDYHHQYGLGQACAGERGATVFEFLVLGLMMLGYSCLLAAALVVGAPWWVLRMATSGRYRAGLGQRLGRVSAGLRAAVEGRKVVWVHAVSVGEVLAAGRLVGELQAALNSDMNAVQEGEGGARWVVVVSTTTATGQALARERFGADRVFFYPLDFRWAVRTYLRVLRPRMLVLMESELWPRMLLECGRAGVPIAVVNARVSDRSYARGVRVRAVWGRVIRRVELFLAQSDEDARRLVCMGAGAGAVRVVGNLKFDVRAPQQSSLGAAIREAAVGRPVVVAGSTLGSTSGHALSEEEMLIQAWEGGLRRELGAMLVLAPRHPERFAEVESLATEFRLLKASGMSVWEESSKRFAMSGKGGADGSGGCAEPGAAEIVLLDTIGDLAAVYGVADVAFVGGSLVAKGGHNPLEPAQFGVPVVMGPSYENFRDIVERMRAVDGISILGANAGLSPTLPEGRAILKEALEAELTGLLTDREAAQAMGERGRRVFEQEQGATGRTVAELMRLVKARA